MSKTSPRVSPKLQTAASILSAWPGGPSALSYSLVVLYGSFLRGEITQTNAFISISMGIFVFIAANAKDIGDIDGDIMMGSKTLPMIIGIKNTAWLTLIASTSIGLTALLSYIIFSLRSNFLIFTSIAISILIAGGIYLVKQENYTPSSVRQATGFQSIGAMILMFSFAIST
jgi:4-hydroxybenzoate polyprenyltransferase